jgi:hypothetical protein
MTQEEKLQQRTALNAHAARPCIDTERCRKTFEISGTTGPVSFPARLGEIEESSS